MKITKIQIEGKWDERWGFRFLYEIFTLPIRQIGLPMVLYTRQYPQKYMGTYPYRIYLYNHKIESEIRTDKKIHGYLTSFFIDKFNFSHLWVYIVPPKARIYSRMLEQIPVIFFGKKTKDSHQP